MAPGLQHPGGHQGETGRGIAWTHQPLDTVTDAAIDTDIDIDIDIDLDIDIDIDVQAFWKVNSLSRAQVCFPAI